MNDLVKQQLATMKQQVDHEDEKTIYVENQRVKKNVISGSDVPDFNKPNCLQKVSKPLPIESGKNTEREHFGTYISKGLSKQQPIQSQRCAEDNVKFNDSLSLIKEYNSPNCSQQSIKLNDPSLGLLGKNLDEEILTDFDASICDVSYSDIGATGEIKKYKHNEDFVTQVKDVLDNLDTSRTSIDSSSLDTSRYEEHASDQNSSFGTRLRNRSSNRINKNSLENSPQGKKFLKDVKNILDS